MYTTQYFIDKFSAIPEENWFVGEFVNPNNSNQRCAFGHCGMRTSINTNNTKQYALSALFYEYLGYSVDCINDGLPSGPYKQSTPKERILAALNDIKKKQQREQNRLVKVYGKVEISDPPVYVEDMIELCEIPG